MAHHLAQLALVNYQMIKIIQFHFRSFLLIFEKATPPSRVRRPANLKVNLGCWVVKNNVNYVKRVSWISKH